MRNMAEGGYDLGTNPYDNTGYDHGDDHDDDGDRTPEEEIKEWQEYWEEEKRYHADKYKPTVSKKTYERWKSEEQEETPSWDNYRDDRRWEKKHGLPGEEMEMKERNPFTKTSTSKKETSFGGGKTTFEKKLEERENVEEEVLNVFPNIDKMLLPHITLDDYDRLIYKGNKTWKDGKDRNLPHVIAVYGKPSYDYSLSSFPKGLKKALGKSNVEINEENHEKQRKEEEKQVEREQNIENLRSTREGIQSNLENSRGKLEEYSDTLEEYEKIMQGHPTTQEAEAVRRNLPRIKESIKVERGKMVKGEQDLERLEQDITREEESVRNGQERVEAARERVNQRLLSLRERVKEIFKKHGFTVVAVVSAIGVVIGVIVSNLKAGLTSVAKGVGNGLKELGAKLGQILPGMVGAIASFIFKTAGEVIGFLAKNAWLLIVGLVVLAVEQFKKRSR